MNKSDQIDEIIRARDPLLLVSVLWDDITTVNRIKDKLNLLNADELSHCYSHFVVDNAPKLIRSQPIGSTEVLND